MPEMNWVADINSNYKPKADNQIIKQKNIVDLVHLSAFLTRFPGEKCGEVCKKIYTLPTLQKCTNPKKANFSEWLRWLFGF